MPILPRLALAAAFTAFAATSVSAQTVSVALDWTPNTNHIGLYVADALGFYEDAGISVEILPYADTAAGTLVANGVADFGVMSSIAVFTQRTAGADVLAAYAVVQTETGRLVFDGNRDDIQRPRDLDGLTYAGFGSAWENALIESIIRHDGGEGRFDTVTLGTSAYEALANGAVDFTLEVSTWEGVRAERDGRPQGAFRYADYGVPDQHTTFISTSEAFIAEDPEAARAFIQATRRGYEFAVANPDEATDILVNANADALTDRDFVRASLAALIEGNYLQAEDGTIGTIDPEIMDAVGSFVFETGVLTDIDGRPVTEKPDFSTYYTNDLFAPVS